MIDNNFNYLSQSFGLGFIEGRARKPSPTFFHERVLDGRTLIQTQLQPGFKPSAIAASLNRPRSVVV